ncbi:MAG: RrF2 family transcriptional regulator [Eubacteriales bacterium]
MMISTRGRYALRVIIDLAENNGEGYTAMKEVADRQGISLKYLERILPLLVKANMIEGIHGKGGGYRLTHAPEDYRIGDIIRLTEGNIISVSCLDCKGEPCRRSAECRTLPMWKGLDCVVNGYLDSITVADLMK